MSRKQPKAVEHSGSLAQDHDELLVANAARAGIGEDRAPTADGGEGHAPRAGQTAEHSVEHERDRRLHEASAALFDLLRGSDMASGNDVAVYRTLTELVARTLEVDRVSIWRVCDSRTHFRCIESYDARSNSHHDSPSVRLADHQHYFQSLAFSRYVEAHDSCGDPRAFGTPQATFPGDVSTQLDVAIRYRGEVVGALCLDCIGASRRWRSLEQVFAGSIADLIALVIESNERRRAELALRESEIRFRELWQNARDGMFTLDPEGRLTSANDAGAQIAHRSPMEVIGRFFTEFIHPNDASTAAEAFKGLVGTPVVESDPVQFALVRPDGSRVQVEVTAQRIERNGKLVEVLATVRDVSQRRELEMQLQQSQKMEAIGRLAGGVAHDFNNLLTAIIGYSQIASIRPDLPAAAAVDLKEITSAAHRAAALTRQLLAFSRRQVLEPRVLDVNAVVSGIEVLLRRLIGEEYDLVTDLDATVAHVLADPGQLEQVVLNLAVNARDAMPSGGRIVLRTRKAAELDRRALVTTDAAPGPYVVLEVTDTGVGMDRETRARIFEPFFTTKTSGTGLGLSTVYGIVQQSGGGIAVTSEVGFGSTFAVYLPVAAGNSDDHHTATLGMGPGGHETILVVEDDDIVRALAARVLRLAGYSVLEASNPRAAMDAVERQTSIDLVLIDLVLPRMRGPDLMEHLRAVRPRLLALYMSGYAGEASAQNVTEALVPKPFTPESLTTAIREALDVRVREIGRMV